MCAGPNLDYVYSSVFKSFVETPYAKLKILKQKFCKTQAILVGDLS
jgi:hypothetical protein